MTGDRLRDVNVNAKVQKTSSVFREHHGRRGPAVRTTLGPWTFFSTFANPIPLRNCLHLATAYTKHGIHYSLPAASLTSFNSHLP